MNELPFVILALIVIVAFTTLIHEGVHVATCIANGGEAQFMFSSSQDISSILQSRGISGLFSNILGSIPAPGVLCSVNYWSWPIREASGWGVQLVIAGILGFFTLKWFAGHS